MEIVKFTQRLPADLAARVDAFATSAGIGRNAAINVLLAQVLGSVPVPSPRIPTTLENVR